jgi:hypothetical protein
MIKSRERKRAAHAAMNCVDRIIRPIALQELHDVAKLWVDCALGFRRRVWSGCSGCTNGNSQFLATEWK